jgi:hypothetical protein
MKYSILPIVILAVLLLNGCASISGAQALLSLLDEGRKQEEAAGVMPQSLEPNQNGITPHNPPPRQIKMAYSTPPANMTAVPHGRR